MRLNSRWWVLLAVLAAIALFFAFDLGQYLNLAALKRHQATLEAWRAAQPLQAALAFFAAYVLVTAMLLPGVAVMTLAVGAVFGLGWGLLIVSFVSSIGALLAFLTARGLLGDWVQARFADRLATLNAGMARDCAFYLFVLRRAPRVDATTSLRPQPDRDQWRRATTMEHAIPTMGSGDAGPCGPTPRPVDRHRP